MMLALFAGCLDVGRLRMPVFQTRYPLSALICVGGAIGRREALKRAKSWVCPRLKQVARIILVALSTTAWAFNVWRFFLPE